MSTATMATQKALELIKKAGGWIINESPMLTAIECSNGVITFAWDCPELGHQSYEVSEAAILEGTTRGAPLVSAVTTAGEAVDIRAYKITEYTNECQ